MLSLKRKMKISGKWVAKTGLLLALTVVFQSLSRFLPLGPLGNFVTGSLVNAGLLVSLSLGGLWSGAAVAVVTPFCALLTGSAMPLLFTPFVAAGNFLLVLLYHLGRVGARRYKYGGLVGLCLAAAAKFLFLLLSIHLLLPALSVPEPQAAALLYLFGWPQLVTALLGGFLALAVSGRLKAALDRTGREP